MQEEYLKHYKSGWTTIHIYRTYIYPKFLISRATFYNWLTVAPKKELEKLQNTADEQSDQKEQKLTGKKRRPFFKRDVSFPDAEKKTAEP